MVTTMTTAATEECSECGATFPRFGFCIGCDIRTKVFDAAMDPAPGFAPALHADDARLVAIAVALKAGAKGTERRKLVAEEKALSKAAKVTGRWAATDWSGVR